MPNKSITQTPGCMSIFGFYSIRLKSTSARFMSALADALSLAPCPIGDGLLMESGRYTLAAKPQKRLALMAHYLRPRNTFRSSQRPLTYAGPIRDEEVLSKLEGLSRMDGL